MRSLVALNAAQTARAMSFPEQAHAPLPAREAVLEGWRNRNAVLDYLFYDLSVLDTAETARLAPRYAAEGAILCVHPSDNPSVHLWPDYDAYRASGLPREAKTLVVAGVGSSALGAAAFARNVADAVNGPVLAVVSGYGLADLLSEAMGGFFLFGTVNAFRHWFEPLDTIVRPNRSDFTYSPNPFLNEMRCSLDVKTLIALFSDRDFDLVVGHSKGNLVISEALFALSETDPDRSAEMAGHTRVVTISAKIFMPPPWRDIIDVMGEYDNFGMLNSRRSIETDIIVPRAWHHTNREIPMSIDVTNAVAKAMAYPKP